MKYCIVEDGTIVNMIICDSDEIAAEFGAVAGYSGAAIGQPYSPPEPEPEPEPETPVTWGELAEAIRKGVNSL